MRTLLLILMVVGVGWGRNIGVCPDSNCTPPPGVTFAASYTNMRDACTGGLELDTIYTVEGPSLINSAGDATLKRRMTYINYTDDTLSLGSSNHILQFNGDSINLIGALIKFNPALSYTFRYAIRNPDGTSIGGHRLYKIKILNSTIAGTRGPNFFRWTAAAVTEPMTIVRCRFDTLPSSFAGIRDYATGLNTDITIDSCLFYNTGVTTGERWTIKNSIIRLNSENVMSDSTHHSLITYCSFHGNNNVNNELITWDECNNKKARNNEVSHCNIDSVNHVHFAYDAQDSMKVHHNKFINRGTGSCIYNHNNNMSNELNSTNCDFYNNTFVCSNGGNAYSMVTGGAYGSNNIKFRKALIIGNSGVSSSNCTNDTLDSIVCTGTLSKAGWDYEREIITGVGTSFLLDSVDYPFHRHTSIYWWAGKLQYLSNKKDVVNITDNGATIPCSLSIDFRRDNGVKVDTLNSWITGDTAKTVLYAGTDIGSLTPVDSAVYRAGDVANLSTDDFSAGTKVYFLLITTGVGAGTTHLIDTIPVDSLTTTGSTYPPVLTVNPVNDTAVAGGTVSASGSWAGDSVRVAWWYYHGEDSTYTTDSVFTKTVTAANNGDSAKLVLWNTADTIAATTIYFTVVYAVFDSVNTGDSNQIYVHGNFLSGSGWTATLSDSALTTTDSSDTALEFTYSHIITLSTNKYQLIITNGTYTITLYIGKKKSTGNDKPSTGLDIGL